MIHGLRDATTQVLYTMACCQAEYVGLSVVDQFVLADEACGVVRLRGVVDGLVAISCGLDLAQDMVSHIIGMAPDEIRREDLLDGIAELTNMICGGMKTHFGGGGHVDLLSPSSVIGKDYVAQWKTQNATSILLFQVDGRPLRVSASF
ncbi:MAG: chemotaxis protein CheX, partial [Magnetococcales bacterium]|nr:chemotaxis protein CheX [Magnetococcales bacterium]